MPSTYSINRQPMITKIEIKNFKRFENAIFELGERVIFIGPNNAGKTTCLQALALWHFGLAEWYAKKSGKVLKKRTGVTLNRKDIISIPISKTILLWSNRHVKSSSIVEGKQTNENIKIEIHVEGVNNGRPWSQALEFDYANSESFYCRPIGNVGIDDELVHEVINQKIAFLQPMSGLAPIEPKLELGRINVLLGEGQTAQILRNLCFHVFSNAPEKWYLLTSNIQNLFGAKLFDPEYNASRGEIHLSYSDKSGIELDLTSSGRGFQQMILLLAYLYSNPNSVLLLDEPDAHLEILRQRQMYKLLSDVGDEQNSQIIIASHSEVLLNEAAEKDMVIAFVGRPHRIDTRGRSQVAKALREIGFDQYYQAEQTGWVLYLEGSTDLSILQGFAKKLGHSAEKHLARPFVHYVDNLPSVAQHHFYGLREAKKDLVGIAIFDRLNQELPAGGALEQLCWTKREIENYFITKDVLLKYVTHGLKNDLFGVEEAELRTKTLLGSLEKIENALSILKKPAAWSDDIKMTTDFLDLVFEDYYQQLRQTNMLRKSGYHILIDYFPAEMIDPEVVQKLDRIATVAERAMPESDY